MTHPCDGHSCDHCYLCDVVGVCCSTVSTPAAGAGSTAASDLEVLRRAIVADSDALAGLGQLIAADGASPASALEALAAAGNQLALPPVMASRPLEQPTKEDSHVIASRRS